MATGTEGARLSGGRKPPAGLRARTRATSVVADDTYGHGESAARTPPMWAAVTVPFLWEVAPGRPKTPRDTADGAAPAVVMGPVAGDSGATDGSNGAKACPVRPLKLPPRLQVTTSSKPEHPRSPRTVIRGPYAYGCTGGKRPPRALGRGVSFRRASSAGGGRFFSWGKAAAAALGSAKKDGHDKDTACCSPSASSKSSSSSSSSSLYCVLSDHGRESPRQPDDELEDSEGSVPADSSVTAAVTDGGDHDGGDASARPVPEDGGVTQASINGGNHDGRSSGARPIRQECSVTTAHIDDGDHDGASVATRPVPEDGGVATATTDSGDHDGARGCARHVPLKQPPRLHVTSKAEQSISPKTVLHGPNGCAGSKKSPRTLRRTWSMATFRRIPSAGGGSGGFFARTRATEAAWSNKKGSNARDASRCSPSPSASSSSSSSKSWFGDDHGHGPHRRPVDGRVDSEEEDGAKWPVKITRLQRNKSFPSMTTSHLWASICRSVKQITPWS